MLKVNRLLQLSFILLFCSFSALAETIEGVVLSIHDGDTLKVKTAEYDKPKSVRLRGVDTPEISFRGESQGEVAFAARDYLRSLIPIGASVKVDLGKVATTHSRLLGKVFYQGQDIGLLLIAEGLAAPYFIYPFEKRTMTDYQEAARFALENKIGFLHSETEMPYEFRMRVQNYKGTNYVGDSQSKFLYLPEDVSKVHYTNRVFFKYYEDAQKMGYSFQEAEHLNLEP